MRLLPAALALVLAAGLAVAPAVRAQTVSLTPEEADAIKLRLIAAKPNVSTVTIASFVFPGSSQAYMGHVDRTLLMWGTYLLAYTGAKVAIPESSVVGGQKVSDLAVVGFFMGMAAWSAIDAYVLSVQRRADYDLAINRLTERTMGLPPASLLPIRPAPTPLP
jgi:hypothetical protein